ncbi:uncharacterized protein [Anabrus simplex]|uniref:uncharacterized protein isoform X2 n=1 Tax=Anabrus simplex TaxID=316456 RepID=UPI0035A2AB79
MTTATALNVKIPYVALQRLCIQDVAGLKLTSPEYKTISLNPSSKGNKDTNVKEGRSIGVSTRRTNDSNVKEGRWLKEQDGK